LAIQLLLQKMARESVLFFGEILPIFDLKIWFQPIQRIFHGKNGPNLPDFNFFFPKSSDFYDEVPVGSQAYRRIVVFKIFISSL
jgi:hypothetical protein